MTAPAPATPSGIRSTPEPGEGLIEAAELGRPALALGALVVFFTLAMLIVPSTIDTISPTPERKVYGLEKNRPLPNRGWLTGDAARRAERYVKDHSRVRRRVHSLYSIALYTFLGEAGQRVVVGRDEVLFLRSRLRLDGQTEDQAVTNTSLLVSTVVRRMKSQGVHLLFLPVPRKGTLDAEFLPHDFPRLSHLDRRVIEGLKELGVETVDLLTEFAAHSPDRLHFFPQDSHWDFATRVDAARALGKHVRPEGIRSSATSLSQPFPVKNPRDIQRYLGTLKQDLRDWTEDSWSMTQRVEPHPMQRGTPPEPIQVWLFGTSYTDDPLLSDLMEHYAACELNNMSKGGGDPLTPLVNAFENEALSSQLPDLCVFEFPIHMALARGLFVPQFRMLTSLPEAGGNLILDLPHVLERSAAALAPDPPPGPSRPLGYVEASRVLRRPNGAVVLRLRARKVPQVATRIRAAVGEHQVMSDWPAGRLTCDIPLLTDRAGANRIDFYLMSPEGDDLDLSLEQMDLLLDAEEVPYCTATIRPLRSSLKLDEPVWQQRLLFDPPVRMKDGPFEMLMEVRTGEHTTRPFGVRAYGPDGTVSKTVPFNGVQRLGYVTFPLSMFDGLDISKVEILGKGKAPGNFTVGATVHRAAPSPSHRD